MSPTLTNVSHANVPHVVIKQESESTDPELDVFSSQESEEKPTDLSMDVPTDLSTRSANNGICSTDASSPPDQSNHYFTKDEEN